MPISNMSTQVCVNCCNEKPVNLTDNRLITESCGHVKCISCLLLEKAGCLACLKEKVNQDCEDAKLDEGLTDSMPAETELNEYEENKTDDSIPAEEDLSKKKKPETSHIRIETDASGRCYVCMKCNRRFHARSQVAYHAYCNGLQKPYRCLECKKDFSTHSHYKYHMRVHRNERTYPCEDCGESFFQMSKLQRHKLKHTNEKKYVCTQCNKAFNNLTSLRKHGLTHTEERPHKCTMCGRRFRDRSNYKKHVKTHAKRDDKKCTCGGCGHGRGRCGARPQRRDHQCPRCPQAFHSSKDMRRHAAVHTDSKPFRCKVCDRRFRRKDNLERHIRNTHPDYVTSSAVECDETALKQISNGHADTPKVLDNDTNATEKNKLEEQNPLPPLSQKVIQELSSITNGKCNDAIPGETVVDKNLDKSYILVANNGRQSVIVGKRSSIIEKPSSPNPGCEYVHKIRRANSMASHNNVSLPPIDEKKVAQLVEQASLNKLAVLDPPKDKKKLQQILYEDGETREPEVSVEASPQMHWRKMKLNIN